jgi:hypothetical protein
MSKTNHIIMGSALGLAAIAIALDHTHHTLPAPVNVESNYVIEEGNPCSLDSAPCALTENPCSLDSSPCSL